ncbi:hypothetical protein BD560DRAFT_336599 [Blakeslea trispora]|nr:hypothetical protein BD560DRAFT_336599 [Blakeslea trispora]
MDLKEHEKQERRRIRRQERILASAESRLNKITASQTELTPSPTPSPSNSNTLSLAEHYPASNDTRRRNYESVTPSPSTSAKLGQHRPVVQQLIEEEEASRLNQHGFLDGKISPLLLASMLRRTSARPKRSSDPANRYWHLLHFVSMAWLGILAVYEQASTHGWAQVSGLIQQHPHPIVHFNYTSPDQAAFIKMVSQLPIPLQQPVYLLQTHGLLIHSVFKDICIVVFIIGFTSMVFAMIY